MKLWKCIGFAAAGVLAAAPAARAHQLACEKTVNGKSSIELDKYPATLTYHLVIDNTHPESASEVLEATESLLDKPYYPVFKTPFTIPYKGSVDKTIEVEVGSYEQCLELAKKDGHRDEFIDNTFTVRWDSGSDVCTARVECVKPGEVNPPPTEEDTRRMTGGGSIFKAHKKADRVTHGFQLRCDASDPRQNLEVNFQGNHFHLLELTEAVCTNDPDLNEEHPVAGFDTFEGKGTGRYNGVDGATIEFKFTDDGEPGKNDFARYLIKDKNGNTVLEAEGTLTFGNHQAHPK